METPHVHDAPARDADETARGGPECRAPAATFVRALRRVHSLAIDARMVKRPGWRIGAPDQRVRRAPGLRRAGRVRADSAPIPAVAASRSCWVVPLLQPMP